MIFVFDSGVGGLTVLKALQKILPDENFIYFGDTIHLPYGEKTKEQIYKYVISILSWADNPDIAVMACNTSSALVYSEIKDRYSFPLVDTIQTTVKKLRGVNIGIMATSATVKSNAFVNAIHAHIENAKVFQVACPALVPLIESGVKKNIEMLRVHLQEYLGILVKQNIDTLVLGCTHYPILIDLIKDILPSDIRVVDPAVYVAEEVSQSTPCHPRACPEDPAQYALDPLHSQRMTQYYVSGDPAAFSLGAYPILGYYPNVEKIDIQESTQQTLYGSLRA